MPTTRYDDPPVTDVELWQREGGWRFELDGLGSATCQTLAEVSAGAESLLRDAYGEVPDGVEYLVMGFGNELCPDTRGRLVAVDSSGYGDEEELAVAVSHDGGLDQAHISLMVNGSDGPVREGYISLQLDQIDFLQQALAEVARKIRQRRNFRDDMQQGRNPFRVSVEPELRLLTPRAPD